jgi:outer membrane protein assembly factor BamD
LNKYTSLSVFIIAVMLMMSCGSVDKKDRVQTAEDAFKRGMEYFDDEDWIEAKAMFDVVRLQYPTSEYADDAQYYLARVSEERGEFIMAAFNYNRIRKLYPASDFAKDALFKAADSYYKISPHFERDQEYTVKAIESFQEFQYLYPDKDSLFSVASEKISELRTKLAHREYFTATLYRKLNAPLAAKIYFDRVINDYDDTEYYEPAYFEKIEVLFEMEKYDEVISLGQLYLRLFNKESNKERVEELTKRAAELKK